jgi:type IV pilus assembly protein PilN
MIRINLLPVRTSRRLEAVRQELILGGVGVGLLALLCGVFFMFQSAQANELRRANAKLQEDLDKLRLVVARVDEVEKINDELRRKLLVINNLQASKSGPVHLLDELSAATPEKLYVTKLDEKSGRLRLSGNAASNEVISQFLINLEKTNWFEDVYLISIDQVSVNEYDLKNFEVSARVVVPKVQKAASDKEGEKAEKAEKAEQKPEPAAPAPANH